MGDTRQVCNAARDRGAFLVLHPPQDIPSSGVGNQRAGVSPVAGAGRRRGAATGLPAAPGRGAPPARGQRGRSPQTGCTARDGGA